MNISCNAEEDNQLLAGGGDMTMSQTCQSDNVADLDVKAEGI